jgi:uncharacterized membrane protein
LKKLIRTVGKNLHWIITIFLILYVVVPILSPIFLEIGWTKAGWTIQNIYRFLCHQRPERSYFLFGEKLTYTIEELREQGYRGTVLGYDFIGNKEIGYKMAFCSRDLFMYSATALSGLFIALYHKRIHVSWWILALLLTPMIIDGTIQLVSEINYFNNNFFLDSPFYLSNNLTRAITGALFGLGTGLFMFSELKAAIRSED